MTPRKGKTSIWIDKDTAARLKALGRMGDTYDVIVRRLLDGDKGPAKKGKSR